MLDAMRVIGTVGLPGCGKGEFARVARTQDIPVITMGDVVRAETRSRGLDPAEHHGAVAKALREENGPLAIAERALPMIRDRLESNARVVVDGLRSGAEAQRFEAAFGDRFLLVAITAPDGIRAERLDHRGRDDTASESIVARDERELGFGMGEAIDRADLSIVNADQLELFRSRASAVLEDGLTAADSHSGIDAQSGDEPPTATDGGAAYDIDVEITAPLYPTETAARVREAIHGIFPTAEITTEEDRLVGRSTSIARFSERLHEQAILDAARDRFLDGVDGNELGFELKKQAAVAGVVNFPVGSPAELGTLSVSVRVNRPAVPAFLDLVAPPTEDGEPIDPAS